MNKHQFIEKLIEERRNVLKAIEGVTDAEFCKPMAAGKWSIKDTLGHLTAWEAEVINAFEQKARGQRPTIGDIKDYDAWNGADLSRRLLATAWTTMATDRRQGRQWNSPPSGLTCHGGNSGRRPARSG